VASLSGRVAVDAIERLRTVAAVVDFGEIEIVTGKSCRCRTQIALQVTADFALAGFFDATFQLAVAAFFLIHDSIPGKAAAETSGLLGAFEIALKFTLEILLHRRVVLDAVLDVGQGVAEIGGVLAQSLDTVA